MDIFKQLLLQLILILLNAFFAATEIAVISLNEKRVRAQAEDGDKTAKKMLRMIDEPTRFLSTIQIGITLAGFLGSAFAADNFAAGVSAFFIRAFGLSESSAGAVNTISVILITLILSFFTLVFGELVPKRVAMRHKEKLAKHVCGVISFLAAALKPIIWLLTVSTNAVLRLFGIDPEAKEDPVSEDDIVLMLDAGADEGSLKQDDIELIKNVFKLDRLSAEDVMTPRKNVVFISADSTPEEILTTVETEGYSRLPVIGSDEDNVVGILYARDFLLRKDNPGFSLADVMVQPIFVPETIHLDVLFRDMQKDHNHIVIAVNEFGETSGIVTLEDIIEEIFGEIWDERDEAVENITQLDKTTYRVLSGTPIGDFFEYFDIEADEEPESSTVNGWLTEIAGTIPDIGYSFDFHGLNITVTKANDIMTLEITVKRTESPEKNGTVQESENTVAV